MNYDQYGQCWTTCNELFDMLYENPDINLDKFLVSYNHENKNQLAEFNNAVDTLYADVPKLQPMRRIELSVEEFDNQLQSQWFMPDEYKNLDIAQWLLDQCNSDAELQRVGEELLLYQERDLFNLLRYLKYIVDIFRKNNIVWGLGRGSSVSSYVLYLIGVHKINSMYYDLDIGEFLR